MASVFDEDFDVESYLNEEHDDDPYDSSDEDNTLSESERSSDSVRSTPDSTTSKSNHSFWWDDVGIMDHLIHHSPQLFSPPNQARMKASTPTTLVHCAYTIFPLSIASPDPLDSEGTQLNLDELLMLKSKSAQLEVEDISWLASQFINVGLFEDAKDLVEDVDSLKISALPPDSRSTINNILGYMLAEEQRYAEAVEFFRLALNDLLIAQPLTKLDTSHVNDIDVDVDVNDVDVDVDVNVVDVDVDVNDVDVGDVDVDDTSVGNSKHLMMMMQTAINGSICLMQQQKYAEVDAFMQWMHAPRWHASLNVKTLSSQPMHVVMAFGTCNFVWGRALLKLGWGLHDKNVLQQSIERFEESHHAHAVLVEIFARPEQQASKRGYIILDELYKTSTWIHANIAKAFCGLEMYFSHTYLKKESAEQWNESAKHELAKCAHVDHALAMVIALEETTIYIQTKFPQKAKHLLENEIRNLDHALDQNAFAPPMLLQLCKNAHIVLEEINHRKFADILQRWGGLV